MLGRIMTAMAGQAVAKRVGGAAAGPAGAVLGMLLPTVSRRLGPLGMIGLAVGSWAVSRAMARRKVAPPPPPA